MPARGGRHLRRPGRPDIGTLDLILSSLLEILWLLWLLAALLAR